jgi:hypothetical protein
VKLARQANTGAPIPAGEAIMLLCHHLPQLIDLFFSGVLNGKLCDGTFDQTPCVENLAGFLHAWAGHHCAPVGANGNDTLMCQL